MAHRLQRVIGHIICRSRTGEAIGGSGVIKPSSTYGVQSISQGYTRCCVVTGAASGIGLATVLRLEKLGWHVLATDLNEVLLKELDATTSNRVTIFCCDVSSPQSCKDLKQRAEEMVAKLGVEGLSALANVAGLMQPSPAAGVDDEELRKIISVNCEAPVRLTRLLMPLLLRAKQPTICNVASITAELAFPWGGVYSATKGFVSNFSDSLRREAVANGLPLRVSVVKPGFIDTPMTTSLAGQQLKWCEQHPDDPFTPALQKSAARNEFIRINERLPGAFGSTLASIMGDPQKPIRNPPGDVADQIVHALSSDSPRHRYFTGTMLFKGIVNFAGILPSHLRDVFLMSVL